MRHTFIIMLATILVVLACSDDDPAGPKNTTPPSPYKDLSEEWHVLYNLEVAYEARSIDRYAEIFDAGNFVFYFFPGDVGGDVPASWVYADEIQSATNMFSGDGGVRGYAILSIDLTLRDVENLTWGDVTDHPGFPGETLRRTSVEYGYIIKTSADLWYITSGTPMAEFTVRQIDGKWKLVEWSDLSEVLASRAPGATEETTWGAVKALYR